jgi:hypothetical protein
VSAAYTGNSTLDFQPPTINIAHAERPPMRLRHQLAQVQAQAHAAGGALARGVGPVERLGQVG